MRQMFIRLFAVLAMMLGLLMLGNSAFADDPAVPANGNGQFLAALPLTTMGLFFVINLVLPALVDLVTKRFAETRWKAFTLLALQLIATVVLGFSNARNNGQVFDWVTALEGLITALIAGAASIVTGKPLNLIGADSPVAKVFPAEVGLGPVDRVKVALAQGRHEAPETSGAPAAIPEGESR